MVSKLMLFHLEVGSRSIPFKANVTDQDLTNLGFPFTRRCSTEVDEDGIKEVIYNDFTKRVRIPVYRREWHRDAVPCGVPSGYPFGPSGASASTKPSWIVSKLHDILKILPCAVEEDLSDDYDDLDVEETKPVGEPLKSAKLDKLLEKWAFLSDGLGD